MLVTFAASPSYAGLYQPEHLYASNTSLLQKISDDSLEVKAKDFVEDMGNEGLDFLKNHNLTMAQKRRQFKKLLDTHFDIKTIARFALGIHWKRIEGSQKTEYLKLFEEMVIDVYSRRFNEYQGQAFKVTKSRKRGKRDVIVTSYIVPGENAKVGNANVAVDWRLRHKDGGFRVVDIAVEGISMIMTQRDDFSAVIQKGNGDIEALLSKLRKDED